MSTAPRLKINDAVTLSAICEELGALHNLRIEKILMPTERSVVLQTRFHKLLISCDPAIGVRLHLTDTLPSAADVSPSFLMFLRKHISGGIIEEVVQATCERIVSIKIRTRGDFSDEGCRWLICELMGKYANIFVADESHKILNSLSRTRSDSRPMYNGMAYELPEGGGAREYALSLISGLTGIAAPDWDDRLKIPRESFIALFTPDKKAASVNEAAAFYYRKKGERDSFIAQKEAALAAARAGVARYEKITEKNASALAACSGFETEKLMGELITANIYRIPRGTDSVRLQNYYTGEEIDVPLESNLSPQENAQKYYKRYNKNRARFERVTADQNAAAERLAYYRDLFGLITRAATTEELDLIPAAAADGGKKNLKSNTPLPAQLLLEEYKGFKIYAGKTDAQNDYVTFKIGRSEDIWLHALGVPGGHVLIRAEGRTVPHEVILRAAGFAAARSKSRASDTVAVDYTLRKYVKKVKGAPAGKVTYSSQKTVFVTPQ